MKITVIDGQGGNIGRAIVEEIRKRDKEVYILALGTNSAATSAMMKGGASQGATGENPVLVASRDSDYIIGPVGIIMADSMLGEISPKMAAAVGASNAHKVLIPINRCVTIAGVDENLSLSSYIRIAVDKVFQGEC